MRISDWSSDVCSSDLGIGTCSRQDHRRSRRVISRSAAGIHPAAKSIAWPNCFHSHRQVVSHGRGCSRCRWGKVGEAQPFQESGLSCILYGQDVFHTLLLTVHENAIGPFADRLCEGVTQSVANRSEEHTSELQSLMRISYAVF